MTTTFFLGQSGYESLMLAEICWRLRDNDGHKPVVLETGPGFVLLETESSVEEMMKKAGSLAFPHLILLDAHETTGGTVNALAAVLLDKFLDDFRTIRVENPWPFDALAVAEEEGLSRRAAGVRDEFSARLKARLSRVARLAARGAFPPGAHRGWMMVFSDFGRVWASSQLFFGGQRRMADDPEAPSRSYLKVEEAYRILGDDPGVGEQVVDLGAAPGGWSYSAARRGAEVTAVDNGPLKTGAAGHPRITHLREDGFSFLPTGGTCDWLFCDMVEDPFRILRLLGDWVEKRRCRRFVVNLKFGRTDPMALLEAVERFRWQEAAAWSRILVRHLFHDREEFTVVGRLTDGPEKNHDDKQGS